LGALLFLERRRTLAKHTVTIHARPDYHGLRVFTDYSVGKNSPFYLAVKHRKNGDFNLIVYEKTSSVAKRKKSRS
jgi:hypothetical protein